MHLREKQISSYLLWSTFSRISRAAGTGLGMTLHNDGGVILFVLLRTTGTGGTLQQVLSDILQSFAAHLFSNPPTAENTVPHKYFTFLCWNTPLHKPTVRISPTRTRIKTELEQSGSSFERSTPEDFGCFPCRSEPFSGSFSPVPS